MSAPDWRHLVDLSRPTYTNLFSRLPDGLAEWHVAFLDAVDREFEAALSQPHVNQLDQLGRAVIAHAGTRDMAALNTLMELYRVLRLEHFEHGYEALPGDARIKRALFRELWHLSRRRLQALLGRDVKAFDQLLHEHGAPTSTLHQGWCDGSYRDGKGYAGVLLRDMHGALVSEASVHVAASSPHDSEVKALLLMLSMALGLGARSLQVHVDAAGLSSIASGVAPLRFCVQESLVQDLLSQFNYVKLVKVPRLYNVQADALTRRLKE